MSRQRHDSKRGGDARPASEASRQRRQTQKSTKTSLTSLTAPAGSQKKRPTPRSPQLIIPTSTPTSASIAPKTSASKPAAPKTAAPKTSAPKTVTNKAAPKARKSAANKPASPQREQLVAAMALADATIFIEEPPITQMPDLPEIPESPATPDIPDVPAMLDTPDTLEVAETPETPETPEMRETPEVPEPSEVTQAPEALEAPEALKESAQPTEPDSPAPMAQDVPPHSAAAAEPVEIDSADADPVDEVDERDTPVTPTAAERRLPTLAVMSQRRRESATTFRRAAMAKHAAALDAADLAEEPPVTPDVLQVTASQASTDDARQDAQIDGNGAVAAEISHAPGDDANATSTQQQQPNIITRPVSARYNNRQRKMPRLPDLIWENDPHLPDLPWPMRRQSGNRPHPLPPANLLMPVIVFQTCAMAIMGLVGALLGLDNASGAVGSWTLAGAFIAGLGSAVAYVLSEIAALKRLAPYALLVSQLGLLTWAMALLGPRPSLLALAPALIEVMLLLAGTLLASILALGTMLIYAFFAGLKVSIGISPVVALDPTSAVVVDVICIVVGMLAALWLLLAIQAGRERALAIARARRHEADVLRNLVTQFRQEAQDDTGKLEAALLQALKGRGIDPIPTEGMYRLLAETIMDTASRLEVLQRDREERLRLEGALRVVIRAVERQWLGIKPEWPGHTGTAVDELVALLRTPRLDLTYQNETESRSITPRLIPIPTLAVERDTPPPTPISRPLSSASWVTPRRERRAELYPVPSTDEDFVTPDPNSEQNGNSPAWNDGGFWPVQDEP